MSNNPSPHPTEETPKPPFIYILGAPGAGKGTLCALLAKHFTNIHHFSVGDHLRALQTLEPAQITEQTFGGLAFEEFDKLMQERTSLQAENIIAIVDTALHDIARKASDSGTGLLVVLIDGFPRSPESAELANYSWGLPKTVFFFDCPRHLAEQRFLSRKRSVDDSVEIFRARYDKFEDLNGGIMELYGEAVVRVGTETGTEDTWEVLKTVASGLLKGLGSVERTESVGNQ